METEKRFFNVDIKTERAEGDNSKETIVSGHGAVFNQEARIGWFDEVIEEGAFDEALKDSDVRALMNHDSNFVLGRTKSKTLTLSTDKNGLAYRYISPDTTFAKDLIVSMNRGDVDQSSFAFTLKRKIDGDDINGDEWHEDKDGNISRKIVANGIKRIYDVSVVTYPAYEGASAQIEKSAEGARSSYDEYKKRVADDKGETDDEKNKRALDAILQENIKTTNDNYLKLIEVGKHK